MSSWVFFGVLLTAVLAFAARAILARSHPPLHPMTAPSTEPFLLRYARQAAKERRVVWIRYQEPDKEVIEEKVEIYQTMWNGNISGWCHVQHCRGTFHRSQVLAWQLLDERFERSQSMGRWAQWEGWPARVRGSKGPFGGTHRGRLRQPCGHSMFENRSLVSVNSSKRAIVSRPHAVFQSYCH